MSVVVLPNSRAAEAPVTPPVHEDGTRFPFQMHYRGEEEIAFADSPAELLGVLISGYEEMDPAEQQRARIRFAIHVQVVTQAQINAEAQAGDDWDALSEVEQAVLSGPRFEQPAGWGGDDPMGDVWEAKVPLVLLDTGYAPYTDTDRPISGIADVANPPNMIWLRPVDEWEFLLSLAGAGYIRIFEATDL